MYSIRIQYIRFTLRAVLIRYGIVLNTYVSDQLIRNPALVFKGSLLESNCRGTSTCANTAIAQYLPERFHLSGRKEMRDNTHLEQGRKWYCLSGPLYIHTVIAQYLPERFHLSGRKETRDNTHLEQGRKWYCLTG
jgi:hypothetical protein